MNQSVSLDALFASAQRFARRVDVSLPALAPSTDPANPALQARRLLPAREGYRPVIHTLVGQDMLTFGAQTASISLPATSTGRHEQFITCSDGPAFSFDDSFHGRVVVSKVGSAGATTATPSVNNFGVFNPPLPLQLDKGMNYVETFSCTLATTSIPARHWRFLIWGYWLPANVPAAELSQELFAAEDLLLP